MDFQKIANDLGSLLAEKNAAYGDSFHRSGEILKVFFPDGIKPDNYTDILAFARIIDKMFRIATNPDYGGESPWQDIAGYSLLRLAGTLEAKKNI